MEKFTVLEGVAAPLKMINVDTDMVIPKQYLKTIKRTGLGKGLFAEKRYRDDGSENPDFVLNKPAYRKAKILVAGDNFGCGSSREHAPWALKDFGITCVISTSFGDIFYNNCFKNGILPVKVSPQDLDKLFDDAERGANATLTVDLVKQEIRGPDGGVIKFEVDAHRKHCLLNGLDDIGLTMVKSDKIERFEDNGQGGAALGVRETALVRKPEAVMTAAISVAHLDKTYASGFQALKDINLEIRNGEIFALLGPNGAGKTTLISIVCGIVNPSAGRVAVDGHDIIADYRAARSLIGLVPQELTTDAFASVWATVSFSRGLFGKPANPAHIAKVLKELSLWDKKDDKIMTLSGGMKRRVMIAKALSHEPRILFLDEPTAGVDVELRKDMWDLVRALRASGVTIILTTHYIEEAEQMADRIGVINKGQLILVENKAELMRKLGRKQLTLELTEPIAAVPAALAGYHLVLAAGGNELIYTYDTQGERTDITALLDDLKRAGDQVQGPAYHADLAGGHFCRPGE